jgi:hypothetical protein
MGLFQRSEMSNNPPLQETERLHKLLGLPRWRGSK